MSTPKEKKVMFEIIEMYKNMPLLWDKTHADYRNKFRRTSANNKLLEIYKQLDEEANMKTLTKKILNLRTNYYRELRRIKEAQTNEDDDEYQVTLWYFDAFTFLGDNASEFSQSKLKDPLKTEVVSPSSSDGEESYQNSEPSSPPIKKRKFTNPITYKSTNDSNIEADRRSPDNPVDMKDEDWEIFGKAIGIQLRGLDKKQLAIAQKLISDSIYYAKFGLLTQQAYINLGATP